MRSAGIHKDIRDMSAAETASLGAVMSSRGAGKPSKPPHGVVRTAGGETWRDPTLDDWPENDSRLFVGNLGNEVNDDLLTATFQKYSSFQKAKVVRNKFGAAKSKGYGFVSFADPRDMLAALKEMNGKPIGTRPVQLKRSTWADRNPSSKK